MQQERAQALRAPLRSGSASYATAPPLNRTGGWQCLRSCVNWLSRSEISQSHSPAECLCCTASWWHCIAGGQDICWSRVAPRGGLVRSLPMLNLRHIEVFHAVYQSGSVTRRRARPARLPALGQQGASACRKPYRFPVVPHRQGPAGAHRRGPHPVQRGARSACPDRVAQRDDQESAAWRRWPSSSRRAAVARPAGRAGGGRRFRARHPHVSFEIQTLHNEDILRSLYERNSDLAVAYDAPRHPRLAEILLGSGELVISTAAGTFPKRLPAPRWTCSAAAI